MSLEPFFLSKFEITQDQYERCAGRNPSRYKAMLQNGVPQRSLLPLESLTWFGADEFLKRYGLQFPTEAQWEYAARASLRGAPTAWWKEPGAIQAGANLADQSILQQGQSSAIKVESWNDSYPQHAPVGRFEANPFGLHDMIGNVSEWCRDSWSRKGYSRREPQEPDGLRLAPGSAERLVRGGSYANHARRARLTQRERVSFNQTRPTLGLRPARGIL